MRGFLFSNEGLGVLSKPQALNEFATEKLSKSLTEKLPVQVLLFSNEGLVVLSEASTLNQVFKGKAI